MTRRTVVITGAAGGMCTGINRALAEAGHRLVLADRDLAGVRRAAAELADTSAEVHAYSLDLTDADSVAEVCARASELRVDALVNAAGILEPAQLDTLTLDAFRRVLEVNLLGPFAMIQALSPQMVERGWGRIINISSLAAVTGYAYPAYGASKAGLSNLTRSLLVDLHGTGVTINAICPGPVDTPMASAAARERVGVKLPTGRMIEPREIGAMVEFLLQDLSGSINGAELMIDGGATALFEMNERQPPRK